MAAQKLNELLLNRIHGTEGGNMQSWFMHIFPLVFTCNRREPCGIKFGSNVQHSFVYATCVRTSQFTNLKRYACVCWGVSITTFFLRHKFVWLMVETLIAAKFLEWEGWTKWRQAALRKRQRVVQLSQPLHRQCWLQVALRWLQQHLAAQDT